MASRRGEKSQRCGQPWVAPPKTKKTRRPGVEQHPGRHLGRLGPLLALPSGWGLGPPQKRQAGRVCSFSSGSLMGLADQDAMRWDEEKRTTAKGPLAPAPAQTCEYIDMMVARWPLLWTVPALGDSGILGFWASGRCSPSAPLDQAPGRSFLALLAGGRGADWRWPGDQLRFTFLL